MTQKQVLIEEAGSDASLSQRILTESGEGRSFMHLVGPVMVADVFNVNKRKYTLKDITRVAQFFQRRADEVDPVAGELNHPPGDERRTRHIEYKEASHLIMGCKMHGNYAHAKLRILNTPNGNIVRAIAEAGGKPGVSSRGLGMVDRSGTVYDYDAFTLDIVSFPSGPGCKPSVLNESILDNTQVRSLAECVVHDPMAQKYLVGEVLKVMRNIRGF